MHTIHRYDAFADFHRKFYHPGNARFYFYGDAGSLPLADRLAKLEGYLAEFGRPAAPVDPIPIHRLLDTPYEFTDHYPVDAGAAEAPKQV